MDLSLPMLSLLPSLSSPISSLPRQLQPRLPPAPSTLFPNSLHIVRTMLSNLHAGSLGCAPTPNQYFALTLSRRISLNGLPSPSSGTLGIGSYVPRTSIGLLFLAVLWRMLVRSFPMVSTPHCRQSELDGRDYVLQEVDGKAVTHLAWVTTML